MFTRKLSQGKREKLMASDIFKDKLLNDIKKTETNTKESKQCRGVFPAIRNESIDFYYGGGRLFHFDEKFTTHVKFASVYEYNNDYVAEDQLNDMKPITSFLDSYEAIKKTCCLYTNVEAEGVSSLYSKYSYFNKNTDIVILDIEIAFPRKDKAEVGDKSKGVNIIDLLLYNKRTKTLRFYEAKDYSNSDIKVKEGNKLKVIGQIKRYEETVNKWKDEILNAYKEYIGIINEIFRLDLEEPEKLDLEVGLLVFGFDSEQRTKLKRLLERDSSLEEIKYYYPIGNVGDLKIERLWKKEYNK